MSIYKEVIFVREIKIILKQFNKIIYRPEGVSINSIAKDYKSFFKSPIMAGRSENEILELCSDIYENCELEFIDLSNIDGLRIYTRGMLFVLFIAARQIYGPVDILVHHSISTGLLCEISGRKLNKKELLELKERMKSIVKSDYPFIKGTMRKFKAIKNFGEDNQTDKANLFKYRRKSTVNVYWCNGYLNYFYGYLPISTGCLQNFDLILRENGLFVLNLPSIDSPEKTATFQERKKLEKNFLNYEKWGDLVGVNNIGDLNDIIVKGHRAVGDLIRVNEALHEKRIASIANKIKERKDIKIIFIAGPSSSGKTTFAQRLIIQLKVLGIRPKKISLDDYFVDRDKNPKDENGNYDFETTEALQIELFNEHMRKLLMGKDVKLPNFDFIEGKSYLSSEPTKLERDQMVVIEGIHALNPLLTRSIEREKIFKIYASALTQMNIDNMNRIPTTDVRLLRRIVRDNQYRGHSVLKTLKMWKTVRKGEEKYIFPFQEEADTMFNSALIYELAVLKLFAEPLLIGIDNSDPEYIEAKRLVRFLNYFLPVPFLEDIPLTSIIREFIGGSSLR